MTNEASGSLALPEWLIAELSPAQPYGRVEPDGQTAVRYLPPDGPATTYDSIPAAYDALRGVDLDFSEALITREDGSEAVITFGSRHDAYSTMWFARNDARDRERLLDAYRRSLGVAEAYHRAESSGVPDFLAAYGYLDKHPAFWIRSGGDSGHRFWRTTGHMNRVELEVWRSEDGGIRVGLETGMHTPDMTTHFHDPYLDAVAETFEAAVLQLARNVSVSHHDDGTDTGERPDSRDADELIKIIRDRTDGTDKPGR